MRGVIFIFLFAISFALKADPIAKIEQSIQFFLADFKALNSPTQYDVGALVDQYVSPNIDFLRMSQLILGDYWKRSSVQQKRAFLGCFPRQYRQMQVEALLKWQPTSWKIANPQYNQNNTKLALDINMSNTIVTQVFTVRLHKINDEWLIYDAAFEELSLLKNFKDAYAEKIQRQGLSRTIAKLCQDYPELIKDLTLAGLPWAPFIGRGLPNQGFSVELVSEVFRQAGYETKMVFAPWKRVIDGIKTGEFDVNIAIWHSPQRQQYMAFSQPYFHNQMVVVSHTPLYAQQSTLSKLLKLKGKLGIMDDYAYSIDILRYPNRHIYNQYPLLLRDIANRTLDFSVLDSLVAHFQIQQASNLKSSLQVSTTALESKSLHIAMLKDHPVAKQVLTDFNFYLKKYLKSEQYRTLLARYTLEKNEL